jgi:O-antigen/teichoic acid export membrane protein
MSQSISYKKKYLQIYIWQFLSLIMSFASMFVVLPSISQNKVLYGIYSVCTSLTVFFSFADCGFLASGQKYAAEHFIRGDLDKEMKTMGFTAFVMMAGFSVIALVILLLALFPKVLIPELQEGTLDYHTARSLLLILAFSCPIIIAERIVRLVFAVRVEDYKAQRFSLVGNLIKVLSAIFLFFGGGRYMLVEYFFFIQLVNLCVVITALLYTRKYKYSLRRLFRYIRFDKEIFNIEKGLTATSIVMTISWILFYELDNIAISNIFGVETVALYGIAFSLTGYIRTLMSLLYSPYTSRFNHFAGVGDQQGLMNFTNQLIRILTPIAVFPLLTISLLSKPFVLSWVGEDYIISASLASLMFLGFLPCCLSNPYGAYNVANNNLKVLLKFNILQPVIYWIGVLATYRVFGLYSIAFLKGVTPILIASMNWRVTKKLFREHNGELVSFYSLIKSIFIPLVILVLICWIVRPYMFYSHAKIDLVGNILIIGSVIAISLLSTVWLNREFRMSVIKMIKK